MNARIVVAALSVSVACAPTQTDLELESRGAGSHQQGVAGNIHPAAIQIDGPSAAPPGADLYADVGTPLNVGADVDWVADSLANDGTNCLDAESIATCIETGVTGAADGTGHWNGVRIVDGIASSEQDIFLTGGKENDTATWNIGPGSVGSSKYDMVQAYLANNQSSLFFGMERRGNNGTTAFDFEFNQLAPMALESCPQSPLIPCRSLGDVLFTFEMQGSGSSGSATPFIFTWDGSAYVAGSATGILSSINNSTSTAGGPWGHVDSHGNWVLGNLDRFTFAEATAPLSLLPGIDACGGSAYVQVRTRSSSTITSDLKDTTRIFKFTFLGLTASATLTPSCDGGFYYAVTAAELAGTPITDPICLWAFSDGSESSDCSGFLAADPGTYSASVDVESPLLPGCGVTVDTADVDVYAVLGVAPVLTPTCELSFAYDAVPSGGDDPASFVYAWTFSGPGSVSPASSSSKSGSVLVGTGSVAYTAAVHVSEAHGDLVCEADGSAQTTPYAPLAIDLSLQAAAPQCPEMPSDAVGYNALAAGGNGDYTIVWNGPACSGVSCIIDPADATFCATQSLSATLSDSSALCPPVTSELESYGKVTVVTASDNP